MVQSKIINYIVTAICSQTPLQVGNCKLSITSISVKKLLDCILRTHWERFSRHCPEPPSGNDSFHCPSMTTTTTTYYIISHTEFVKCCYMYVARSTAKMLTVSGHMLVRKVRTCHYKVALLHRQQTFYKISSRIFLGDVS